MSNLSETEVRKLFRAMHGPEAGTRKLVDARRSGVPEVLAADERYMSLKDGPTFLEMFAELMDHPSTWNSMRRIQKGG